MFALCFSQFALNSNTRVFSSQPAFVLYLVEGNYKLHIFVNFLKLQNRRVCLLKVKSCECFFLCVHMYTNHWASAEYM